MRTAVCSIVFLAFFGACTDFPQLDAVISDDAKAAAYPDLVPADRLLSQRDDGRITEQTGPDLMARADRLRARASLIRGIETVDEATRIRLRDRLRALGG